MKQMEVREWHALYAAIVLLTAAAFLYALREAFSPVVLFIVLLILLSPFSGTRYHRVFVFAAGLLMVVWLLRTLGGLLAPFVIALIVAYILDPIVDRLQKRGLKRGLAVAVLVVPLLAIVVVAGVLGIPALIDQAGELIAKIPTAIQQFIAWVQVMRVKLEGIPMFRGEAFSRTLDSFSPERLGAMLQEQQTAIANRAWSAVLGVGKGVTIALSLIGYVVLVPVLIIYLLIDFDPLKERAVMLLPGPARERWVPLLREYDSMMSRYFRGQLTEAVLVGTMTWLGLMVLGFPYSGLVGAIAGLFNLVPYVGLIVSAIPAVLIAFLSGSIGISLLKVIGVFGVVQIIDGTITGPRIVGGSVGLHPVWVILALAVGGFFFGFVGLLLAMPAGVLIKLLLREAIARYRASPVYHGEPAPEEP